MLRVFEGKAILAILFFWKETGFHFLSVNFASARFSPKWDSALAERDDFFWILFATTSAKSSISISSRLAWFAASRSMIGQYGQATTTVDTLVSAIWAKRSWFTRPLSW